VFFFHRTFAQVVKRKTTAPPTQFWFKTDCATKKVHNDSNGKTKKKKKKKQRQYLNNSDFFVQGRSEREYNQTRHGLASERRIF
jgi:hypothetical protein